jgi:trehalose 6-phosphate synthase/phosphatase
MLNGALRINPFDIKRVVTALDHAIRLDQGERTRRRDRDLPYISERPSSLWTRQVLQDLWAAKEEEPGLLKMTTESGGVRVQYQPVWQTTFKHLSAGEVKRAYAKASRRFIFTDFGGTLMEKERVDLYIKRSFTQTTGKRCVPFQWLRCFGGGGVVLGGWWFLGMVVVLKGCG